MNIEIEAEIDFERDRRTIVTATLLELPEPFRPTSFNWGEDERPILISDRRRLGKDYSTRVTDSSCMAQASPTI